MAVNGKVKAHQEIKNSSFLKLLYKNSRSITKKYAMNNINIAKLSQLWAMRIYAINPIAGGAIRIKSVGINF